MAIRSSMRCRSASCRRFSVRRQRTSVHTATVDLGHVAGSVFVHPGSRNGSAAAWRGLGRCFKELLESGRKPSSISSMNFRGVVPARSHELLHRLAAVVEELHARGASLNGTYRHRISDPGRSPSPSLPAPQGPAAPTPRELARHDREFGTIPSAMCSVPSDPGSVWPIRPRTSVVTGSGAWSR